MKAFKHKNKGMRITYAQALNYKPVKNDQVTESRLATGELLLIYPEQIRPWLTRLLRRFGGPYKTVRTKKIQLDTLGTDVWDMMDGHRSVQHVIHRFADKYQLHPKEAEVAVTRYIRDLGKRGLIGLM